jgi:hypothetical protein
MATPTLMPLFSSGYIKVHEMALCAGIILKPYRSGLIDQTPALVIPVLF